MSRQFWFGRTTYADIFIRRRYEFSFAGWKAAWLDLIEATTPVRVFVEVYRCRLGRVA